MTLPYSWRLVCLALASFFLIHSIAAVLIASATPAALRFAGRLRPKQATRWLLALRLAPSAIALLVIAAFCVPSYLWLEPDHTAENVGLICVLASFFTIALLTFSAARATRAIARSRRFLRSAGRSPIVALTGILHPRIVISPEVIAALSADQLVAALRHEEGHRISRDNLKRLLIQLAPGILPGLGGFGPLERAWLRFTEWAADDFAVAGDSRRSLSLAASLVRVARLGDRQPLPCATSLLGDPSDLSARVDRLLHPAPAAENKTPRRSGFIAAMIVCTFAIAALLPATLPLVHRLLETLVQ